MKQSTLISNKLNVAIIMDGNGRWAAERALDRSAGHRAGAQAVRRAVEAALRLEIASLTLYAFSADNWRRPAPEVATLMALLQTYLRAETARCAENGVQINVIGRRDRLGHTLRSSIKKTEEATKNCTNLRLRIAIDYSARDAILAAAQMRDVSTLSREEFARVIGKAINDSYPVPDIDLLIRTGGEKRLSDFLLWESAYAELVFLEKMWPDFDENDFAAAVADFHSRERRFGNVLLVSKQGEPQWNSCQKTLRQQ